jgi:serine/threonine protein kinase
MAWTLVMEYLEGETLAVRLARKAMTPDETVRIGIEVADALDKAHRSGIVHHDLKPGNLMLTKGGAKLMDFGLAKLQTYAQRCAIGYTGVLRGSSGCIVNVRKGHSYWRASITSSRANRALAMPDHRLLEPPPKMYGGEDAVPALVEGLRGNDDVLGLELIIH